MSKSYEKQGKFLAYVGGVAINYVNVAAYEMITGKHEGSIRLVAEHAGNGKPLIDPVRLGLYEYYMTPEEYAEEYKSFQGTKTLLHALKRVGFLNDEEGG